MRVGIIDIDTTHPWPIANYVNATGKAQVVAITDRGDSWPRPHVEKFAERLNPRPRILESPEEMLGQVDALMFCGSNYDLRVERARPFLEAKLPVYIDKPAVGHMRDVRVLESYVNQGARVIFGSSLPFCSELKEVWRRVTAGSPAALTVVGWRTLFEYGIDATDVAFNLIQSPPRRVLWGAFGPAECVWVECDNGQELLLCVGLSSTTWQVSCMTSEGLYSTNLDLTFFRGCHYDLLAQAFIELAESGKTPIAPRWHLEGIKALIAANVSRERGGFMDIAELSDDDGFDGNAYAASYRAITQQADPEAYLQPNFEFLTRNRPSGMQKASTLRLDKATAKRVTRRLLGPKGTKILKRLLGR